MKAIILAAGRGERLRPLTDRCPKPLIKVAEKPLIVHHLERLKAAGFNEVVINVSYLGDRIQSYLGTGQAWGMQITYSVEPCALEVGGGLFHALPLLGTAPFVVINADIWTDYPLAKLPFSPKGWAHLVLVANPFEHPQGDFALGENGQLSQSGTLYTYSGIAVIKPAFFTGCQPGAFALLPLLNRAALRKKLYGEYYQGEWMDIGTCKRLTHLEETLAARTKSKN